jgi:uncharacterized membrane protein YoaK (UPF0700 family)
MTMRGRWIAGSVAFALVALTVAAILWRSYESVSPSLPILAIVLGLLCVAIGRFLRAEGMEIVLGAPLFGIGLILAVGALLAVTGATAASPVEP